MNKHTEETLITGSWEEDPVTFCKDLISEHYDPEKPWVSVDTATGMPYVVATTRTGDSVCALIDAQWILKAIHFRWRAYKNRHGEYAYLATTIRGAGLSLHRFIYLLSKGDLPDDSVVIDHADRIPLNNRETNLRAIPRLLNLYNSDHHNPGSSIFPGVSRDEKSGLWQAAITVRGERTFRGPFEREADAAQEVLRELMNAYPAADWTDQVKEDFFPGVRTVPSASDASRMPK